MLGLTVWSVIGTFLLACALAIACRPTARREVERFTRELDHYLRTPAPLPAPAELWRPRACPDVPLPGAQLSVALRAIQHPCYEYAARLAAMSWQSHKTLQRSYDMLAFATVARSYYRMGTSYVG